MTDNGLFSIEGKTALVTGGSRGIGFMIAQGYVAAGARVYISSRKADACEAAVEELRKTGEAFAIPADLSTVAGADALAEAIQEKESQIDILVNNAGAAWGVPIDEYPETGWDKTMDTNVKGVFFLTKAMLPLLRKAGTQEDPARVINISSIEAFAVPLWENYAYPASKAAVAQLTKHLAKRLAGENITVNALAPGLFPSRMTKFVFDNEEIAEQVQNHIPLGRPGGPDDMAGPAIFLASRAGAWLTGSVIVVDGGALVS